MISLFLPQQPFCASRHAWLGVEQLGGVEGILRLHNWRLGRSPSWGGQCYSTWLEGKRPEVGWSTGFNNVLKCPYPSPGELITPLCRMQMMKLEGTMENKASSQVLIYNLPIQGLDRAGRAWIGRINGCGILGRPWLAVGRTCRVVQAHKLWGCLNILKDFWPRLSGSNPRPADDSSARQDRCWSPQLSTCGICGHFSDHCWSSWSADSPHLSRTFKQFQRLHGGRKPDAFDWRSWEARLEKGCVLAVSQVLYQGLLKYPRYAQKLCQGLLKLKRNETKL